MNNGNLTVNNTSFSTNSANYGGGIFNYAGFETISNSTVSTNSALSYGGGIYNQSGNLTISNSTLSRNSATAANAYGGGIYNLGTLTLSDSTLLSNFSGYGGGGIVNSGTATVKNSTLAGNTAVYGGGMLNRGIEAVNDSTLSGNSGSYGGGIYNDPSGTLNLTNTIVANSPSGDDLLNLGTLGTAQYSLIQSAAGHNIQNGNNGNIVGVDPLLYPLDNYGGPTRHSPCGRQPSPRSGQHSPDRHRSGHRGPLHHRPARPAAAQSRHRGHRGRGKRGGEPLPVTTTADSGPGSLRDAITQVDADTSHTLYASPINPNIDEIDFAITALSDTGGGYNALKGVATIAPQSGLPVITSAVMIDGWSQPGFAGTPLIELNGAGGSGAMGMG